MLISPRKSLRDLAVCGLMLHAGLRVSEVCSLICADLVLRQRSGSVLVLGHKNIRYTVRYTELSPGRFKDFWTD